MPKQKVMLTERAVFARISRSLQKDGMMLRRCRQDSRGAHELGRYFVVDLDRNAIVWKDLDLEQLGRERGILADYEAMSEP